MNLARYGQTFKDRAVARLLPPESAAIEVVARKVGIGTRTLERWRDDARSTLRRLPSTPAIALEAVAGCLARPGCNRLSDAQTKALIKARLKAQNAP